MEIQGNSDALRKFHDALRSQSPPLVRIDSITQNEMDLQEETTFQIRKSQSAGQISSDVTIDTAICDDCLREMFDPNDRRYKYPFINCTNCGPRYTIVKRIPYDRPNTTMSEFSMCDACKSEYEDPTNRRFHAQPIACPNCGPNLLIQGSRGKILDGNPIKMAAKYLNDGKIVGIKGIGGFHLAVDAKNDEAVRRLRKLKNRDQKPFALMLPSIDVVDTICELDEQSRILLTDISRPVVLLPQKKGNGISNEISPGLDTFGVMLPYAPQHYLIFAAGVGPIVMTSGNFSDEPIVSDNDEAVQKLGKIADIFLTHNRKIYRKVDDSVVQQRDGGLILLRRSRGFVPASFDLGTESKKQILAVGAELKNTVAVLKGRKVILSEHIGDLKEPETFNNFRNVINHLCSLYEIDPDVIVADLHDDYLSSRYAMDKFDKEILRVQHHHAHIVSCMVEHNLHDEVIGISADGVGLGSDGKIWGCEFMITSRSEFHREGHLEYFALPGGDSASKQTFRPALSLLYEAFGDTVSKIDVAQKVCPDSQTRRMVLQMIRQNINSPKTSSLGRVFDGVAAMLGIASANRYEGQAPMMLEVCAKGTTTEEYPFEINRDDDGFLINITPMIRGIVEDIDKSIGRDIIADKFHNTVAGFLAAGAIEIAQKSGLRDVVLSGGCFANRRLSSILEGKLLHAELRCIQHNNVSCNDGGIALGQAAIAATISFPGTREFI